MRREGNNCFKVGILVWCITLFRVVGSGGIYTTTPITTIIMWMWWVSSIIFVWRMLKCMQCWRINSSRVWAYCKIGITFSIPVITGDIVPCQHRKRSRECSRGMRMQRLELMQMRNLKTLMEMRIRVITRMITKVITRTTTMQILIKV